jgi:IS4 transposase
MATNLPEAEFSVKEVIVLYRARWQIELLFKRWKSQGLIAQMDSKSDLVMMIKFWIRLCAALLQHWLSVCAVWSSSLSLSLAKAFHNGF